ncbi:MAG: response regulator [candidate division WS1 bacterium]|jgi:CheY-like chemotaxis protein|nr:response regulator [candidate division WS1 bacterium]
MSGKKVLIVKDDPEFVASAKEALEARGFEVLVANGKPRAAVMAKREHPDLIILGLVMDAMSAGCSILSELQFEEETSRIPVIMVSGVTTATGFRIDQGGKAPQWLKVEEFINAPVDFAQLAERVCEIVGNGEYARV